jgi:gamma-butyrobetaine dioxygenase
MTAFTPIKTPARKSERIDMADLADWTSNQPIATIVAAPQGVTAAWQDGVRHRFHAIWLRDNCACPDCRHPRARERRFLLPDTPGEIAIESAALTPGGDLAVRFVPPAGGAAHESRYDAGWLRHHVAPGPRDDAARFPQRKLWDARLAADLPEITYADVMQSEAGLVRWLELYLEYGVVAMRGAPAKPGEILAIAGRIQRHLHPTNFGAMYDVMTVPDPNASADTAMALEPHTDLSNWRHPPDTQLLFCIANEARGGDSVLVDGCRVAEELRTIDPEAFALLASHRMEFRFHDADCDIRHSGLCIETDADGSVAAVRFNNWLRTAFDLPEDLIEPMYRALIQFWRLLREPRFQLVVKLSAGEMLMMNNLQIMHGRTAFDPGTGRRHLQGCYVDLDMIKSRLRVLSRHARAV